MTERLIVPPAALAVSLAEAKKNLRIEDFDTDQDDIVTGWIEGITSYAEHKTGRAFINQTWRIQLGGFPDAIRLASPPVVSVTSVQYVDEAGVTQTLAQANYLVDAESEPGCIVPSPGLAWPATQARINAVTVTHVSGYGTAHTAVPKGIKLFILAKLREQFDPSTRVEKDTVQASFIDRLLDPYKVYA